MLYAPRKTEARANRTHESPIGADPTRRAESFSGGFNSLPNASFERPTPFQRASISFQKFQSISRNRDLSVRYGRMKGKNKRRAVGLQLPRRHRFDGVGPSRRRACPPLPASQGRMFSPSRSCSSFRSSEGLAPLSRWTCAFCALFSTDVVRPRHSIMGGSEGASSLPGS